MRLEGGARGRAAGRALTMAVELAADSNHPRAPLALLFHF